MHQNRPILCGCGSDFHRSPKNRDFLRPQDARLPLRRKSLANRDFFCEEKGKNSPRCRIPLRTPRPATEPRDGPTRNFHEKYQKNTPRAEILEPQENTPKIPTKYQKCAFLVFWGYFFGIFGVFWGKFWESRISCRGVFFRYFSWKFGVGPFRGSVAGRGVLKNSLRYPRLR